MFDYRSQCAPARHALRVRRRPVSLRLVAAALLRVGCPALILITLAPAASARHAGDGQTAGQVIIELVEGTGSSELQFTIDGDDPVPEVRLADAVAGPNEVIPASHIAFNCDRRPLAPGTSGLLACRVEVRTDAPVRPDVTYRGAAYFLFPGAAKSFELLIEDRTSIRFDLSPERYDLTLGPGNPDRIYLRVRNDGNTKIRRLTVSASDLQDSSTHRQLVWPPHEITLDLDPSQEAEVPYDFQPPAIAGVYTGSLNVVVNGTARQPIPLTLRARGPGLLKGVSFFPCLLFIASMGVGFWLATMLEDWFGLGGLFRAQVTLNLQQSERHLNRILGSVQQLQVKSPTPSLTPFRTELENALSELRRVIDAALDTPQERLFDEARRFATAANKAKVFWDAVQILARAYAGDVEKVTSSVSALRGDDTRLDLKDYREAIEERLRTDIGQGVQFPPLVTPKHLRARMNWMAWLYRLAIWLVVSVLAHQIFYADNYSFGSPEDYLGVFLLAACVTQTGTQFLTRFRSSFTRAR